jgi:hypothetical protein
MLLDCPWKAIFPFVGGMGDPSFLLFYKNVKQRTAEQVLQIFGISWTHHISQTENVGLLPTCAIMELTQFHQVKLQLHQVRKTHQLLWREPHSPEQLVGRCNPPGQK